MIKSICGSRYLWLINEENNWYHQYIDNYGTEWKIQTHYSSCYTIGRYTYPQIFLTRLERRADNECRF